MMPSHLNIRRHQRCRFWRCHSGFTGAAAAVAKAHDAGVDPEDGELFFPPPYALPDVCGRARRQVRTASGAGGHRRRTGYRLRPDRSAENRALLTATRVSDRVAGDEAELAAYRKRGMRWPPWMSGWNACARRNPLPANRPTTCANPSTASTESTRSRGRMGEELKARRERIETRPTSPKAWVRRWARWMPRRWMTPLTALGRGTHQSCGDLVARDSRRRHVLRAGRSA